MAKIIETDNYGGDYPDEKFVNIPPMPRHEAEKMVDLINSIHCNNNHCSRYWRVVEDDYELQPGFEP